VLRKDTVMNKFKKLLMLILVLVVTVTVFTVVAFAADETVQKQQALLKFYDFQSGEEGSLAWEANDAGAGTFEVAIAENGNRYIKHHVSKGSGNTSYLSGPYQANKQYSIVDYPYLAIDFDISKVAGDYAGANINPYYYGNGTVYDYFGNPVKTLSQVTGGNASIKMSAFKKYLPTELNTWAHVTAIFKYHIVDDTEYIGGYVYVDGELAWFDHTLHTLNTEYRASNYYFGTFRINNEGSTNTTNFSGYDNWQMNFYNSGYTQEEVVSAVYNADYELPYGVTIAKIGDVVYDRIPAAIEAAKPGEAITLLSDIPGVISVEKTVTFDTNIYNEDGTPSGDYYDITTTSTSLVSDLKDGFLTFKQVQNASVEIFWDDCPGMLANGVCECDPELLDENGEHIMAAYTPSAMLNSVPSYSGEIPSFPIVEGLSKNFIGWSYTPGGEVEDLRPVTEEDVNRGWIALYPVYEIIQYGFELISATGDSSYFLENEYDAVFASAGTGATIKLLTDITTRNAISFAKTLTLDLNGYSFNNLVTTISKYDATYDSETGEYVKGAQIGETKVTGDGGYLFSITKSSFTFTITSSRPGAVMSNLRVSADQWVCDGEIVKSEVTALSGAGMFNLYPSSAKFIILGENITFYTGTLFYAEHGGCSAALSVNIDGGTFYTVPSYNTKDKRWQLGEGIFALRRGGNHTVKNATFYCNSQLIWKNGWAKETTMTFDNCDIYDTSVYNTSAVDNMYITNSRVHLSISNGNKAHVNIGENNLLAFDYTAKDSFVLDTGIEATEVSQEYEYMKFASEGSIIAAKEIVFDPVTLRPVGVSSDAVQTGTYITYTVNPMFGPTNVIFKDFDGNVISEFVATKNKPVEAPIVPLGDGWRAVTNPVWVDSEGNASDLMLGDADEYVFTAQLPEEGSIKYAAYATDVKMGMSYYSHFAYNLYVPKVDGVAITSIAGVAPERTVLIDNNVYYLYTVFVETAKTLDDLTIDVEYVIDDVTYTAKITVNAYIYAMASVNDETHTAEDKEAAGALIRYIEEAYKFANAGSSLSDDVQAKFDAFYAEYTPADYVYPEAELVEVDVPAIDGLVESIYFKVWSGARVGLAVTLTDEALGLGYKVSFGEGVEVLNDGKLFYTETFPLHALLASPLYNFAVVDSEGNIVMRDLDENGTAETEALTEYSMATYITAIKAAGENADLVEAFYAFGKAVLAVRNNNIQ